MDGKPTRAVQRLLKLASQTHLPFLKANAAAFAAGKRDMACELFDGAEQYAASTFKYQAVYCVPQLQVRRFEALFFVFTCFPVTFAHLLRLIFRSILANRRSLTRWRVRTGRTWRLHLRNLAASATLRAVPASFDPGAPPRKVASRGPAA